jgi:hypothetical protein
MATELLQNAQIHPEVASALSDSHAPKEVSIE